MSYRHTLIVSAPNYSLGELDEVVVYICEHSIKGAIGLIINKPYNNQVSSVLYKGQPSPKLPDEIKFNFGGPVDSLERLLILHQASYGHFKETAQMGSDLFLTTSLDALKPLAWSDRSHYKLFLGMMQWPPGDLDKEIIGHRWFVLDYDPEVLFSHLLPCDKIWEHCYKKLGFRPFQVDSSMHLYQ